VDISNLFQVPAAGAKVEPGAFGPSGFGFAAELAGVKAQAPPGAPPPPIPLIAETGEEGATPEPIAPTQDPDFSPEQKIETTCSPDSLGVPELHFPQEPNADPAADVSPCDTADGVVLQEVSVLGLITVSGSEETTIPGVGSGTKPNHGSRGSSDLKGDFAPVVDVAEKPGKSPAPPEIFLSRQAKPGASGEEETRAMMGQRPQDANGSRTKGEPGFQPLPGVKPGAKEAGPADVFGARPPRQDVSRPPTKDEAEGANGSRADVTAPDAKAAPNAQPHPAEGQFARPGAGTHDRPKLEMPQVTGVETLSRSATMARPAAMPNKGIFESRKKSETDAIAEKTDSMAFEPEAVPAIKFSTAAGWDRSHSSRSGANSEWSQEPDILIDRDIVGLPADGADIEDSTLIDTIVATGSKEPKASDTAPLKEAARLDLAPKQAAEVVRQVLDRLEALAASNSERRVTVHLDPHDFGSITLVVGRRGGEVDAEIYASNDRVREALEAHRPTLQSGLENRGIQLSTMTVGSELPHGSSRQHQSPPETGQRHFFHPRQEQALASSLSLDAMRGLSKKPTGVDLWI
jgi:hypothetical protein